MGTLGLPGLVAECEGNEQYIWFIISLHGLVLELDRECLLLLSLFDLSSGMFGISCYGNDDIWERWLAVVAEIRDT